MPTELEVPPEADVVDDVPRQLHTNPSSVDRLYRRVATAAGVSTLVIMAVIGIFLLARSMLAFEKAGWSFFTTTEWNPDGTPPDFGIAAVLWGTIKIAIVAMVIAVPISVGSALFINEYAPRRLRRFLTALVDLLAAIPSLIYGLWGRDELTPYLVPFARFLDDKVGFVPIFHSPSGRYDSSAFIAGVVVSLMVIPIATSVMREVFSQAPPSEKEGALALGGTRWGMIRTVVLPFGRGGIIGGAMLGLGRALAETIAVAIVISFSFDMSWSITETGTNSIAALIATRFGGAEDTGISALMAAGLVLFLLTLVVNVIASVIVSRSRSGKGVEI